MKSRPILFSAPMVRAILAGTKTQTRRIVKPQPENGSTACHWVESGWSQTFKEGACTCREIKCKYGIPGDQLWVKETFQAHPIYGSPVYRADWPTCRNPVEDENWPWRPSIFMPRDASRITLEITSVRMEKLKSISAMDCIAEGIESARRIFADAEITEFKNYKIGSITEAASTSYRTLWESINGPGSWEANPWVWVLEFRRNEKSGYPKD